jgi:hypothetical protein
MISAVSMKYSNAITLQDVAREAGVSAMTVSAVLHEREVRCAPAIPHNGVASHEPAAASDQPSGF